MADWSELPLDLLQLISTVTNTNNSSNVRHFRSVCSSWRSSVPPKLSTYFHSPLVKFFTSQTDVVVDFQLVKQTTFLLSLTNDPNYYWIVKTEEHKQGVFHLLNPLSKCTYIKEVCCNILDLRNINTLELGHEYVLRNVSGNNNNDHLSVNDLEHEKVAYTSMCENDNFTLISTHNSTGKLFMYRSKTQEWVVLDDLALGYDDRGEFVYNWSVNYVDVAEYEGKFYAVTDLGRTVIIDCNDESSVRIDLMVKSIIGGDKKYLVKSNEDLLLIDLYTYLDKGSLEINAIDVYKLDNKDKKWVLLKGLEGRVIFLSKTSSFCTFSSLCGLPENCINFSFKNMGKDYYEKKGEKLNDNDDYYDGDGMEVKEIGVFDYDKGNFGSFEEQFGDSKFFCWPPPSWINLLLVN